MTRNTESHFALNPTRIDMSRSTFDRSHSVKTSFNVGQLVPFYLDEVLPGDTFDVKTSKVVRLQTLLTPVMDNVYLDTYFFFVPNRLVWEHWKEFMGENTQSAWLPSVEYSIPQLTAPEGGWATGTLADYFGVPVGVSNLSVNALPFRAYALIVNDWFRDQNLTDPMNIPLTDATVEGTNNGLDILDLVKGGEPFVCCKYHDYFTSCLPAPQKGPDVTIPVSAGANLPVVPLPTPVDDGLLTNSYTAKFLSGQPSNDWTTLSFKQDGKQATGSTNSGQNEVPGTPIISNLWAIDNGAVSSATINQLRMAFQIQKLYEKDARGGTRYIEIIKSHFGVTSPDARLQRPEYLGGNRIPITINQVLQQSGTVPDAGTPQGTVTGQSLTTDSHSDFRKSFVEHGFVIGVMVARYNHTYQQGLERFWSRKDRFDYYWPVFANLGEQPVKNREIFAQGNAQDDEVFGYQEAWADYRYKPSHVTGEMRSAYHASLDFWHLADDYETLPKLSNEWIREDRKTVNRVLAVSDSNADQLFCDIYIRNRSTRPMPLYSVPGLIDHH